MSMTDFSSLPITSSPDSQPSHIPPMGLRMDSLHSPTIPSSTANPPTTFPSSSSKPSLQSLILQKEALEAELSALSQVLQSQGTTMQTSLTTFDGFPRADIDVAQIRTVRARIVRLKNDWKGVMEKVEVAVLEGFAAKEMGEEDKEEAAGARSVEGAGHSNGVGVMRTESSVGRAAAPVIEPPFARVNSVAEGSPAATAGLRAEDRVVKFGNADWQNHERLGKVAREVQTNEGREVVVKVIREGRVLELKLVPRRDWGGRGLLGCHLVPL
ncbi:putative 26S proteasome regulatory subunit [Oleoguttula sp. CCFEE 5521]